MVASGVSLTSTWAYFLITAAGAEPLRERREKDLKVYCGLDHK